MEGYCEEKNNCFLARWSYKNFGTWILGHLLKNKLLFFLGYFLMFASTIIQVFIPLALQDFFDVALFSGYGTIFQTAGIFLILYAINFALGVATSGFSTKMTENIVRNVQVEFFESIHQKSMKFHDTARTGELLSLSTSDSRQLSFMVTALTMISTAIFTIMSAILAMRLLDIKLLLLFLVFVPFIAIAIYKHSKKLAKVSVQRQQYFARWQATLQENLIGIRALRTLSNREKEFEKYTEDLEDLKDILIKRGVVAAKYFPTLLIIIAMGTSFMFGSYLVIQGEISTGTLIAFNSLIFLIRNVNDFIRSSVWLGSMGFAGGRRVFKVITEQQSLEDGKTPVPERFKGEIEFKNVNFKYETGSKETLKNINLRIDPGETVAIIGHTGSGKTTLVKLIQRLYNVTRGKILIDGINVQSYPIEDLRKEIGVIEQDTFLFSTTIRENILYGYKSGKKDNEMEEKAIQAAKAARIHNFISSLPKGYDTMVGEQGIMLSGGQRQRLAIARAIILNPPILIMDDSTSAVDARTEAQIQTALKNLIKSRTTLIITHRLSTIRNSDKIVLMSAGMIKDVGTHDELYKRQPDYADIFKQFEHLPKYQSLK